MSFTNTAGGLPITGAVRDTNSPFTSAFASVADANPFTIPTGAIGMYLSPGRTMVLTDACEISQEATPAKGEGLIIRGSDPLAYFAIRGDENFHVHWVGGVTNFVLNVTYVF